MSTSSRAPDSAAMRPAWPAVRCPYSRASAGLGLGEGGLAHQHVRLVGERERGIAQPGVHDERETLTPPRLAYLLKGHQALTG